MSTIFIQIASYRDPELVPTIRDCLAKAAAPENLRFGICRQYDPKDAFDNLDEWRQDSRFRVMDVLGTESGGMCWARAQIQNMYDDETYTMQLDSHHRFAENWDTHLIQDLAATGSERPLITGYLGGYRADSANPVPVAYAATQIIPRRFAPPGTVSFGTMPILEHKPRPARFVSGHFFFTLGRHCRDYAYDPELYFAGDEISLSIRSYTLGYDLFHPAQFVVWHEYQTYPRPKHWQDHQTRQTGRTWYERDTFSKQRIRQLLQEEDYGIDLGRYGLGTVRSHREYEAYAGFNFAARRIHPAALEGSRPPTTELGDTDWMFNLYQHSPDLKPMIDKLDSDQVQRYELNYRHGNTVLNTSSFAKYEFVHQLSHWTHVSFYSEQRPDNIQTLAFQQDGTTKEHITQL